MMRTALLKKEQVRMLVSASVAAICLSVLAAAMTPSTAQAGVTWGGTESSFVEFHCDKRWGGSSISVTTRHHGYNLFTDSGVKIRWWELSAATNQWSSPVGPHPIGYYNTFWVTRGLRLWFYVEYTRPGYHPFYEWGYVKQDGYMGSATPGGMCQT